MAHITIQIDSTSNTGGRAVTVNIPDEAARDRVARQCELVVRRWADELLDLVKADLTLDEAIKVMDGRYPGVDGPWKHTR